MPYFSHGHLGTNLRSQKSGLSQLSLSGGRLISGTPIYSRSENIERSVSLEPGSVLERALESLEQAGENKHYRSIKDRLGDAKDSNKRITKSRKLCTRQSEAIGYSRCDEDKERYKDERASRNDSKRSKSSTHLAKQKSKLMLINERIGQLSIPSYAAARVKRLDQQRVFGVLFFTGKTRKAPRTKEKDRKTDKKQKKNQNDTKRAKPKNEKNDHKKYVKKMYGKETS